MAGWGDDDNAADGGSKKKGCFKCGEEGHMSRECPNPGKSGENSGGCRKCGEEGHFARDCPTGEPDKCFKCKEEGHMSKDCSMPDICRKCKEEGHISKDCPKPDVCFKCKKEGHRANDCELPDVCRRCEKEGHMVKDCPEPEITRQTTDEEGKVREIYVPADLTDDKLFETDYAAGINFNKYNDIPVSVTGANAPKAISSFQTAGLRPILVENVITKSSYLTPTPVQKVCLPVIMAGRDLMACAQTGSGKTAAFLLPIIHKLIETQADSNPNSSIQKPQCIIICPTRELAKQAFMQARKFSLGSMVRCSLLYGGTSVGHQFRKLAMGCNILAGTPGRMLDAMDKGKVNLESLQFLVLDEADKMLEMGFLPDIQRVLSQPNMPKKGDKQMLMFSATFKDEIQLVAQEFLHDYIFATIGLVGGACSDVSQEFHAVARFDKRDKLKELLQEGNPTDKTLVFVKTKKNADFIATHLSGEGIPTTSIHGDRFQREREEALYDFTTGETPTLVATAVAARGLDIPGVKHVVNFDLPEEVEEYVHRIGRTGRVGNLGKATSFYDSEVDSGLADGLMKLLADAGQTVPDFLTGGGDGDAGASADAGGGDDDWD
jgi:probable ATP-dependent RNA helicase DDX4